MSKYQSDEKIAESLNNYLPSIVKDRELCISNSLLVSSGQKTFIIYMARSKNQELVIVVIDLTVNDQKNNIRFLPVIIKNEHMLEGIRFQIAQNPHFFDCYSFVAYDPKEKNQNTKEKLVYFSAFSLGTDESLKNIQLMTLSTRQHGQIKDVKWYPFASLTLIVLTQTKILTYKLEIDHVDPIAEISLKNLKLSISNQNIRNGHFQQIAFAQVLNQKEEYSSIGRKLTLYLISKSGQIFLLFPFVCPHILLDQNQQKSFKDLKQSHKSQRGISKRGTNITQLVKNGNTLQIKNDEDQHSRGQEGKRWKNARFGLSIQNIQNFEVELFKLSPVTIYTRQQNGLNVKSCNFVSAFKVLTLNRHTIFLHRQRLMNKQQELKVQILSQQPYEKLMNLTYSIRSDSFALQTVGEFKFDSTKKGSGKRQSDVIRLITQRSMTNEIFVLHNNMTCYRLSFDGLSTLLTGNGEQITDKLIDCDVLFKSNSQLLSISKNLSSIFFIRHQSNTYLFQSIPLQSIQLREIIRSTIEQTQTLFKKLANQPQPKLQTDGQKSPTIDFEKLNQATLINIEKKLVTFNNDSKKYIETKLQKIKKLSENVISKQSILEQQQRQKQQLINLINQAQQNDKRIKQITSNNSQNLNKTQRDLQRRIRAMHKTLDDLKSTFEKQNQSVEDDEDKRQIMIQCKQQADAVINRLEETKFKLIEKRDQLKKSLVLI